MAYTIQKITLDIIIAGFNTRYNSNTKIAIPFNKTLGPLIPNRNIRPSKIQ
jgi:hypothetical protein